MDLDHHHMIYHDRQTNNSGYISIENTFSFCWRNSAINGSQVSIQFRRQVLIAELTTTTINIY
jgi:hypothetical protein